MPAGRLSWLLSDTVTTVLTGKIPEETQRRPHALMLKCDLTESGTASPVDAAVSRNSTGE